MFGYFIINRASSPCYKNNAAGPRAVDWFSVLHNPNLYFDVFFFLLVTLKHFGTAFNNALLHSRHRTHLAVLVWHPLKVTTAARGEIILTSVVHRWITLAILILFAVEVAFSFSVERCLTTERKASTMMSNKEMGYTCISFSKTKHKLTSAVSQATRRCIVHKVVQFLEEIGDPSE